MVQPENLDNQQANTKQGKSQVNFGKGFQPNRYPLVAQDGGVRDILNFELATNYPNPTKSEGYSGYNSSGTQIGGSGPVYWMQTLYNGKAGNDYVLAIREESTGGTVNLHGAERTSKSFALLDSGKSVNAVQSERFNVASSQWRYIVGPDNIKTDGSNVYVIGNTPPSTGFSVSKSSTGSIDGTTKVRVAYLYEGFGESNAGDSVDFTVSSGNIKIESLPISSSSLVNKRKIYRTDERFGGGSEYWLAKTIDDNTTSTTTLTTTGDVIIANQALPDDNSPIPNAQLVQKFANRVFYAGGDIEDGRIIYSKVLKPDQYEAPDNALSPNVIDSIKGEDRVIMGMGASRTSLFILTTESVWVLNGRSPQNWSFNKVHNVGTRSPDSVLVIDGMCYFVGSDLENIYRTDGRNLQNIGKPINNYISRAKWENADQFWAIHDTKKNTYRLYLRHRDHGYDGPGQRSIESSQSCQTGNITNKGGILIDDFEDSDIDEYTENSPPAFTWSVQGSTNKVNSKALKGESTSDVGDSSIISLAGLNYYPKRGETFETWFRKEQSNGSNLVFFGMQGDATTDPGYVVRTHHEGKGNDLRLAKNWSTPLAGTKWSENTSTWYRLVVKWNHDGTIEVSVEDEGCTEQASISADDNTYSEGGFGFGAAITFNGDVFYADRARRIS